MSKSYFKSHLEGCRERICRGYSRWHSHPVSERLRMHDADLENLIATFRGGDPVAFERVWDQHLLQIQQCICSFTADYDERQDLLQVIRIALYHSRQRFAGTGDFSAWVQGLSRQRCLQWARTNRRIQSSLDAFEDTLDPLVDIE